MVQSIIEGVRKYLALCPLLAELNPSLAHIDWTSIDNDNYGIFPDSNEIVGEPYINGNVEMQYTVQINVRKMSDSNAQKLENNAFIERLQNYFNKQNSINFLPEMPDNCIPLEINAVNSMLFDSDDTQKNSTYCVQITLNYIKFFK